MANARPILISAAAAMLVSALPMASAASAQGTDTSSGLAQLRDRETGTDRRPKAQIAPVGAGTTSESTTGVSGPDEDSSKPPSEVRVPPLPNRSLCDSYKDTPAYQGCLWVVLRQEGKQP